MTKLICIVCPKGCHLTVDEENNYKVTGNNCEKGIAYAKDEITNPMRVLTSTVKLCGGKHKRISVKTDGNIPKGKIFEVMSLLNDIELIAPINSGHIVLENVVGTNVNIITTASS